MSSAPMPVHEFVTGQLEAQGVEDVFGLIGDDTALLAASLTARGIAYHSSRHESAAVGMATGYSKASGKLGVAVVSRGPGLTNALTGAINAARGEAPVLIVCGEAPEVTSSNTERLPDFKALDTRALVNHAGIETFSASGADTVETSLRSSIAAALRGRTVLWLLPHDLTLTAIVPSAVLVERPEEARDASAAAIKAAASALSVAHRPLIVAGAGAVAAGARGRLEALADHVGGLLATTLRAKDLFHGHPANVGMIGGFAPPQVRQLMSRADCVVVFGASLTHYSTRAGRLFGDVPIIHVDVERHRIGANHRADIAVVGDANRVAIQLLDVVASRRDQPSTWSSPDTPQVLQATADAMDDDQDERRARAHPGALMRALDGLLPTERQVVTDNGHFLGFVAPLITVDRPQRFIASSNFGVVGMGLATALGACRADLDARSVLFVGDGGLLMTLGELETLARTGLPLLVVVMNDGGYGAERHYLEGHGVPGRVADARDVDFAKIARAVGIRAETVQRLRDLDDVHDLLLSRNSPALLDCKIAADVRASFLK